MPHEHYSGVTVFLNDDGNRSTFVRDEPSPAREALLEWLDFHSVPKHILDGAMITRDSVNHRISIDKWLPEDEIETAPMVDGALVTKTYVDQGEAGPLPFPEIVWVS